MSTPFSIATRLASGLAKTRAVAETGGSGGGAAGWASGAAGGPGAAGAAGSS